MWTLFFDCCFKTTYPREINLLDNLTEKPKNCTQDFSFHLLYGLYNYKQKLALQPICGIVNCTFRKRCFQLTGDYNGSLIISNSLNLI